MPWQELETILKIFGIKTDSWGVGWRRSVEDLKREISNGESTLLIDGDGLLRVLRTVRMIVVDPKHPKWGCLIESYQILKNGSIRRKNCVPAGKIPKGEKPEEALSRELFEELGLTPKDFTWRFLHKGDKIKIGSTYPGLRTLYIRYFFEVRLKKKIKNNYRVIDGADGKVIVFKWSKKVVRKSRPKKRHRRQSPH